jgi:hypothetical protein
MSQAIKLSVIRGYGFSLGNMIDQFTGLASARSDDNWIVVTEVTPGVFEIVDDSMTWGDNYVSDDCALGFCGWDEEVLDLDGGYSDESSCFGMSAYLLWNDVELTPTELRAPSIDRLREALRHVAFCAWCPGDI